MTARVEAGLRVLQAVAGRPDPTRALSAGALADAMSLHPSAVSRLCAELVDLELLSRGAGYGSYLVGPAALELSGRAASATAVAVRAVLARITHRTGETALLAARTPDGARVIGAVPSPWTLHAPAAVGEEIAEARAAVRLVLDGEAGDARVVESTVGRCTEVAVPILDHGGETVAVLAVRLPTHRSTQGVSLARRALLAGRRALESALGIAAAYPTSETGAPGGQVTALTGALRMLRVLAAGDQGVADLARECGLRRDRAERLLESCRRAGVVSLGADGRVRLDWSLHGWLRAAAAPLLVADGAAVVAEAANRTRVSAFVTVLRGIRSVTLVEELRRPGPGLHLASWLGRPCPILDSDGGPALVMDLDPDDIADFLPARTDARVVADFFDRVGTLRAEGVVARTSFEEIGQTGFTAPVRDASGAVVAAACLVGATDELRPRIAELSTETRRLAADLSALVGFTAATDHLRRSR